MDFYQIAKHWAIEPNALQGITMGQQLSKPSAVTIKGGVAIIPIHGVITPRLDLLTLMIGGTALDCLANDIQTALNDTNVHSILLDIDSPGGVAIGPSEVADMIHKSEKPIISYVGRNCCSAAYWLASATSKILCHKTALLGSIGVVATIPTQEQPDKDGYRYIEVVSSNAKNKRPDPRTPEGLDTIRTELDALEDEFIRSVAAYRNLPEEVIKSDFGAGGVLIGSKAVAAGMADELSTFEEAFLTLTTGENEMNEEDIAKYREEGAKAERERLLAIDGVTMAGHEALAKEAKDDPLMTAEKLALKIIEAEKLKGHKHLESLKLAEAALPTIAPSIPIETASTPEDEWNTKSEIRKEFGGDKEAFLAYFAANANGQIKLKG